MNDQTRPPDPTAAMDQDTKAVADQLGTYFKELLNAGFERPEALAIVRDYQGFVMMSYPGDEAQQERDFPR